MISLFFIIFKQKKMSEQPSVLVEVRKNGPLRVHHEQICIKDADGNETIKESIVSFCRCGKSKNQPFCDGVHKTIEPFE
jgi:hypothetical protein